MRLQNDNATPVDPVPFLVTVATGVLVLYSFGPGYLMALGLGVERALAVVTLLFGCVVVAAYYRFVWRARPKRRGEVPGPVRFRRLVYAVLVGIAVLVLLMLPVHA